MRRKKKPLIIVLSGAQGVGKKTLAHQLSVDLQIMQRITLSYVTKIMKAFAPSNPIVQKWNIFNQTDKKHLRKKLKKEAEFIGKILSTVIDKAEHSGENCVIDGVELLPEFLPMDKILFFCIFISTDEHQKRFSKPKITRLRHNTNTSFSVVKKINELIIQECRGYPVYYINNTGTPKQVSKQIIETIKRDYPDYRDRYLWFANSEHS